jgi:hypothetical protein
VSGALARVVLYERTGGRCPVCEFFQRMDPKIEKKFKGSFDALMKVGATYENQERFRPLHGAGKPLWEFKQFDHRLYCYRHQDRNNVLLVVLLSGWVKQKKGKTDIENREIARALSLYGEFLDEYRGGAI